MFRLTAPVLLLCLISAPAFAQEEAATCLDNVQATLSEHATNNGTAQDVFCSSSKKNSFRMDVFRACDEGSAALVVNLRGGSSKSCTVSIEPDAGTPGEGPDESCHTTDSPESDGPTFVSLRGGEYSKAVKAVKEQCIELMDAL